MSVRVDIPAFCGPFDLLLQLVARRKVDLYDVPLADITDDYLTAMRAVEGLDLEMTTEFLVVAATLVELKAARLLPGEDDPELEDLACEARDVLYARLLDYRAFKHAAGHLRARLDDGAGFVARDVPLEERYTGLVPDVAVPLGPADLASLAARVLAERRPAQVDTSHLQPVRMTVREAALLLTGELERAGGVATFRELTAGCRHRVEVVTCFLALLELYKLEAIELAQATSFGRLEVTANVGDGWPPAALEALDDEPQAEREAAGQ